MNIEALLEQIAKNILLELNLNNYFFVQLKINAANQISILYDADASGVKINDLAKLNRTIREVIDTKAWFPNGDYVLEVSSYGIDKPLLSKRQYVKNIGRDVEITLLDDSIKTGTLLEVNDLSICIEQAISKKEKQNFNYPFTNIKETNIVIKI